MFDYLAEARKMSITAIHEGMSPRLSNMKKENEFKDIIKSLERQGVKVSSVEPAEKSKRNKALGAVTWDVLFYFTDGQNLNLSYRFGEGKKQNGQIFGAKINKKVIPINAGGDMDIKPDKVLAKLGKLIAQGSVKFQKQLAKKQAKAETKTAENGEKKRLSQKKRLENLRAASSELQTENQKLTADKTQKESTVSQLEKENQDLKSQLGE